MSLVEESEAGREKVNNRGGAMSGGVECSRSARFIVIFPGARRDGL
jgi:hypothetical protein